MYRPNGTIRDNWLPRATGTELTFGPILQPLEPWKSRIVVVDGIDIVRDTSFDDAHGLGLVSFMTGGGVASEKGYRARFPSVDQLLAAQVPALKGPALPSLQQIVDTRAYTAFRGFLSYGVSTNLAVPPESRPVEIYNRLFATLMPGAGAASENKEALLRARAAGRSGLDYLKKDLERVRALLPLDERSKLDAHAEGLREIERSLEREALPAAGASRGCGRPAQPPVLPANSDAGHLEAGQLHMTLLRMALACDLTRVATFMWSTGNSHVNFNALDPALKTGGHHNNSHNPMNVAYLTAVERFYATRAGELLQDLDATPDPSGGTLLDNTLFLYMTEVGRGWDHSGRDAALFLAGGRGVNLRGGRLLSFPGRTPNDLWLSIARSFGHPAEKLGEPSRNGGPLAGLY